MTIGSSVIGTTLREARVTDIESNIVTTRPPLECAVLSRISKKNAISFRHSAQSLQNRVICGREVRVCTAFVAIVAALAVTMASPLAACPLPAKAYLMSAMYGLDASLANTYLAPERPDRTAARGSLNGSGIVTIVDVVTPAQLRMRFPSHPVPIGMQPILRFVDSSGHKWWLGANSFIDVRRHRMVVYNGRFTCP